jgi:hypothetical protein
LELNLEATARVVLARDARIAQLENLLREYVGSGVSCKLPRYSETQISHALHEAAEKALSVDRVQVSPDPKEVHQPNHNDDCHDHVD